MNYESGKIQTFAGTGEPGYSGDGGPAGRALLREPFMCDFDLQGNLYFSEARNHTVRRVDQATGVITTVAGTGAEGYSGDGGPAVAATLNQIYALRVDTNDDIYVVDRLNAAVRKIEAATGIITTVAGTGEPGYSGDSGPGNRAQLREPNDVFLDGRGGLLIADIQDQRVRRLDLATGIITTLPATVRRFAAATEFLPPRPVSSGPGRFAWTAGATPTSASGRATGSDGWTPTVLCQPWRGLENEVTKATAVPH